MALVVCCLLAPVLLGAAWALAFGTAVEAVLIVALLAFGALAVRRLRTGPDRDSGSRGKDD